MGRVCESVRVSARHSLNPNCIVYVSFTSPEFISYFLAHLGNKGHRWDHPLHPHPCNFHGLEHSTWHIAHASSLAKDTTQKSCANTCSICSQMAFADVRTKATASS